MPANLTPEFIAARERLKGAKTDEERLDALQEMLATIPKHKGTEKMQGDIKRRIAKLRERMEQGRRFGKGKNIHVEREGAAQAALVGPPNSGKSSLLAALTNAAPVIAPYPMSTSQPCPGMMRYEDVQIQIVDLPPVTQEYTEAWVYGLIRLADVAILAVDLSRERCVAEAEEVIDLLLERHIRLVDGPSRQVDWRTVERRALVLGLKVDLAPRERVEGLLRWALGRFPALAASPVTGEGLEELRRAIFQAAGVVRVYTKKPGQPPDLSQPYTLREGATVRDVVEHIHREFVEHLRYVRLWGSGRFDGQHASLDHLVQDKDIVEIHLS